MRTELSPRGKAALQKSSRTGVWGGTQPLCKSQRWQSKEAAPTRAHTPSPPPQGAGWRPDACGPRGAPSQEYKGKGQKEKATAGLSKSNTIWNLVWKN